MRKSCLTFALLMSFLAGCAFSARVRVCDAYNVKAPYVAGRAGALSECPAPQDRIVSFWNVGPDLLNDNPVYRAPYYMVGMENWKQFIAENIEPEYAWGCRRWLLHNPFGITIPHSASNPMPFDQFLLAQEHGFTYLTDDFREAWADFKERHPDAEVMIYLGKISNKANFREHIGKAPEKWIERALESARPALELNMPMGFDASCRATEDDPAYAFIMLLQNLGTKVYVEAWPDKKDLHLARFGVIAAERFYKNRVRRDTFKDCIPPDQVKGEIIILVTGNLADNRQLDDDPVLLKEMMEKILERGFSVALPVRVLRGYFGKS